MPTSARRRTNNCVQPITKIGVPRPFREPENPVIPVIDSTLDDLTTCLLSGFGHEGRPVCWATAEPQIPVKGRSLMLLIKQLRVAIIAEREILPFSVFRP